MNKATIFKIIFLVILLALLGFVFYDRVINEGQIQDKAVKQITDPFKGIIFQDGDDALGERERGQSETGEDLILDEDIKPAEEQKASVYQITDFPTAGWSIEKEGGDVYIIYSSISNGGVYKKEIGGGQSIKIVDNFIPNAEKSFLSIAGGASLFQYWNDIDSSINTYAGIISSETKITPCPLSFPTKPKTNDISIEIGNLKTLFSLDTQLNFQLAEDSSNTFTENLKTSVKDFQKNYNLVSDGIIGQKTLAQLVNVCENIYTEQSKNSGEVMTEYSFDGTFLPQNILSISMSPSGKDYFYLMKKEDEIFGFIINPETDKKEQIFQNPLTEWNTKWINNSLVTLTTKPSAFSPGYLFGLNPKTKNLTKILGGKNGLITNTSPSGNLVLISHTDDTETVRTELYDVEKDSSTILNIKTFADKCSWGGGDDSIYCGVPFFIGDGNYPDDWYMGLLSFTDDLVEVSVESGEVNTLSELNNIDISEIKAYEEHNFIIFKNKIDETLWFAELK